MNAIGLAACNKKAHAQVPRRKVLFMHSPTIFRFSAPSRLGVKSKCIDRWCRAAACLLLGTFLSLGCSESAKPYRTAPVSGVITLDGAPLAGAHVTYMPSPAPGRDAGPEASGDTGSDGRYTLATVFGDRGASIGKNRVMVSTRKTELDPTNPDRPKETAKERIPTKYFTDQAPLIIDVPPTGTQTADFQLTTK